MFIEKFYARCSRYADLPYIRQTDVTNETWRIRMSESITVITLLLAALNRIDLQAIFDRDP